MIKVSEERSGRVEQLKFRVVLEAENVDELLEASAGQLALDYATKEGFYNAGVSDYNHPYAIDANTNEAVTPGTVGAKIGGFRREFILQERLR